MVPQVLLGLLAIQVEMANREHPVCKVYQVLMGDQVSKELLGLLGLLELQDNED